MPIKFTFEILAKETKTCSVHNHNYTSYMFKRADGSSSWSGCDRCKKESEQQEFQQEQLQFMAEYKKRLITRLFNQAAIPPRFMADSFDNYIADTLNKQAVKDKLMKFANNISNNLKLGRNVILMGNPGNGKTHLSVAIAKTAINKGYSALFTTVGGMIDKINEAGWNKAKLINNYALPDLLILDEVTNYLNNEEQKNLFKVLNSRYEQVKSTIIQTNLAIEVLNEVLGKRIIDRLRENNGILLRFDWESYRK